MPAAEKNIVLTAAERYSSRGLIADFGDVPPAWATETEMEHRVSAKHKIFFKKSGHKHLSMQDALMSTTRMHRHQDEALRANRRT